MAKISAAIGAALCLTALLCATPLAAQAGDQPTRSVSKVRIVRISQVKGLVNLDRNNGRGFEPAIANLPVVEKSRLETGMGVAEIEFEDNSSIRVAPNSLVEFPKLERLPGGTTVSSVQLVKGMAYFSMMKTPGDEFNLLFGSQSVRLPANTHVRLQVDDAQAKLAVLDGSLNLETGSGEMAVAHKRTVTFSMLDSSQPTVAKDMSSEQLDSWDHSSADYHARSAAANSLVGSPYAYGSSDMSYYGSFMDTAGCGSMWRPYFASASWEPYSNGAWAWYEGAGYSWVSPYPWAWTPYHYGSWSYCAGTGWGWMPGGEWMGLNNTGFIASAAKSGSLPTAPLHPPRLGELGLTAVNLKPVVHSEISPASEFVFRNDSAGLGIPREGLGKLDKFSEHAIAKGSASTAVYFEQAQSSSLHSGPVAEQLAIGSMHRGVAPPAPGSTGPAVYGNTSAASSASTSSATTSSTHATSSAGGGHH
jgi:hypothetical protein